MYLYDDILNFSNPPSEIITVSVNAANFVDFSNPSEMIITFIVVLERCVVNLVFVAFKAPVTFTYVLVLSFVLFVC